MARQTTQPETSLIAELNDLLQLDHDAVQAYSIAIQHLQNEMHRDTLVRFRGDHERHIAELSELIRGRGGVPVELPHLSTGVFKLAVQRVGAAGDDGTILLAFKANERQVRDKYRRASRRSLPVDVIDVLRRAASDEETHYTWVVDTLTGMGYGPDTTAGKLGEAFETQHAATADAVEGLQGAAIRIAESAQTGLREQLEQHPLRTVLIALGTGMLFGSALRSARR